MKEQLWEEPSTYQYIHFDPSIGANYYRLKQIDYDGRFELSDIRFFRIEETNEAVSIYPNPTYDFVTINSSKSFETASVYNINGQLIKQIEINELTKIDLSELESGVYFIRPSSSALNDSNVSKIVKL
jgi:hypothetical protein